MIFKTIDADATNLTKKMGLLGKSFNDIKKDYSNGLGITKSLFSTSISESDWKSLQKFNSAIKVTNDGLTKSQRITKAWNENMTGCSIAAKRMGNDLVTGKKKISDVSSTMKTATASTKALEIAMNVFANVGFMLAITAVTKVISELAQAQSNAVETAKEATSAYNDELSSIKDYKEKISELNEELNSGNLSYEETKTKRSELMSIQDELIEKFGTEKSAIESVTEAIGGQVDALDNLNEKSYRDWIAKADDETIWTKLLPWGKSGLDQAIDYMESKKTISFFDMANANSITQDKYQAPITDEIRSIQEEIDKTIQSKYKLEKEFATFKITGTPEEVKSQLEAIRQDYLDLSKDAFLKNGISSEYWDAYRSEAIDSINDVINQFDEGLEKHQETYKTYIEGMIKYDSEYSDEYATILRKRAELEDAENSGDAEKVQKARQEFMDAITAGITASESDENIKKYFESLYPELQAEFANWNFEIAINANTDNLKDEAEEIGKQYSATDLLDMVNTEGVQEGEEAFNKLIDKAIEYGVCTDNSSEEVQKLIDLLVELGIVQGNIESDVEHETPISSTDILAQVQALSTGLDQLDKIYADVYNKEDFDWSSILNNDGFKEAFGNMTNVTEDYKNAYDDFIKTISNNPADLSACQSAFDNLATAYIYNSDALKNVTEETKASTIAMLNQMGIVNAAEVVNYRLGASESYAADTGKDLESATLSEITAFAKEADMSDITKASLAAYVTEKIHAASITITTSADINNLTALCSQLGVAGTALAQFARLKAIAMDTSGKYTDGYKEYATTAADQILQNAVNAAQTKYTPQFGGGSATKKAVNDAAKSAKDAAKDVKEAVAETFDFIENGINRFDKALSKLEDKAAKTSSSFTSRLNAYKEALNATSFGIELLTDDYNKYMQKANEVGLNEDIASAVRGGASNIWDYSDDTVKQQIKDYQNWYDKAQDCLDKIDELKDKQLELTQASIELLITQYEKLSTKVENANDRMEKWISLKESWGFSANTKNYDSMNKNIQKQIDYINKQDEQLKLLQKTVTKGSEAWYEYNERIDSNKASLIELKQQMQENATAAAALAKATADKKTEKYDSQDELYDAKIDNATSAKSKNKLIDKKISNINKTQKAYNTAVSTDNKKLKSAKKTISKFKSTSENKKILASIKKAAKSGKRISQSLLNKASKLNDNGKLYNACVQYNAYLDAKEADKSTADLYKETAKQDKATLAKEKFDNISSDYENKISSNEQKKTSINNKISLAQEQGKQISAAYYKSLISSEKGEKNKLIKERKDLQKSLNDAVIKGSIKKGSDEWYEMVSAINEVTNAIDKSTQSIVEYQNALRQLKWDAFDKSLETVKRINSEADYYIDLLSHKDMTDKDTGNFTEYGIATIGLHKTNYDNYIAQADEYQREYNKIMRQIEKGELSLSDENVVQRLRDLQNAHRDAKKSAEDELQSIQDLVKQGYEAQTDALSELIDKYKKLKDSELEAYKYQKEIAEKTKTIASLQKQLTAYNGNDSEESRAQIQKLKVQLEEAKSDLKDTQYEKFISDTEDMLDDLMTDYQKFIDEKLNDTNTILDEIKTLLGSDIIETIKGLDSNLTNDTKDQIGSSTTNGGDGGQAAKDYVHNTVTNDQNKVNSKTDISSYDPAKEADIAKKKNGIAQKKKAINGQRQSFQNQIKELESQLKQLYGELNSIENKYQFEKSSTKNKDKLQDLKNNYIEKKSGLNAMIQDVTHNKDVLQQFIADLDKQSAQLDKDLASINGYEKGSEHIDKRQLAWTQENKRELIYRAADGALLTELNPGDKVFTNEMTENLWELAKTNPSLLYSSTNFVPKLPDIAKSAGTSTIVEVGDIVMNGVNDPETFGRQLREEICKNGKTTQCIAEAVSAKQLGKNRNSIGNARLYK